MGVEELKREAELLSEKDRGDLIAELLATFRPDAYDVSDEEVSQRVAETDSGEVKDISFDELKAGIHRPDRK
ncbi:MAG: hypothetical protein O3A87_02830 [Verrucomicrobia bacterium]|nr:hypothetical protein [Verrucomicrobiota bacterium]